MSSLVSARPRLPWFDSAGWHDALRVVEAGRLVVGKASKQKLRNNKDRRRAKRVAARPTRAGQREGFEPSQDELVAAAVGEAVAAICHGDDSSFSTFVELLAHEQAPGWTRTVSRMLTGALRASVTAAWRQGWQPAELVRHAGRGLSAVHERKIAEAIADEARGYPAATVDDRWAAQLASLDADVWWGGDADYLAAHQAIEVDLSAVIAITLEAVHAMRHLPTLERFCPLPGEARAGASRLHTEADERVLGKIRALLAKAESTEFPEEAEALSARAQELMAKYSIDHALLAARAGSKDKPGGRRLMIDNPYEQPKAGLLQTIATANRCRTVWLKELGMSTVVGFQADLDAVELLFTSLLVQANSAMLREGAKRDAYGRSRTRAFRQSFLISYAVRIGERLTETAHQVEQAVAAASPGQNLLPVLAARYQAVDDAVHDMFGNGLINHGSARPTDSEGWYSGRAAADLATLHNREQVTSSS
jgi:hypothetical protein